VEQKTALRNGRGAGGAAGGAGMTYLAELAVKAGAGLLRPFWGVSF
jgi:hypothetical protein